ncbi:GNAT family N-acetyltransferase [Virgibacillus soli]
MKLDQLHIRSCTEDDAEKIAKLYNAFGFGPVTSGYPLKESDIRRFFEQMEIILFLCMEYEENIIATVLFTSVCGQKAAGPHAVWGSKLFIHPQFRNGPLPGILFSKAIVKLTDLGYQYIDVDVDPSHHIALPLYKRVGFIRSSRSYIDYDGFLELRNYLPYVINFLKTGYRVTDLDESLVDSGWKSLLNTKAIQIRSSEKDTFSLYGMETYKYEMTFGDDIIACWIDLQSERVAMMADPRFHFISYSMDGQEVIAGQPITLRFEYENRLAQTVLVTFQTTLGNERMKYKNGRKRRFIRAGEKIVWEENVTPSTQLLGPQLLQTTIKLGTYSFTFHYGIHVKQALEVHLCEKPTMILHQWAPITVAVKNNLPETIVKYYTVQADDEMYLEIENNGAAFIALKGRESKEIPLRIRAKKTGTQLVYVALYDMENQLVYRKEFTFYSILPQANSRYMQAEKAYLEDIQTIVELDAETGSLKLVEKTTDKVVAIEAWPDLDYPFTGAMKRMNRRNIKVLFPKTESKVLLVECKEGYLHFIREITLTRAGFVQIHDYALGNGKKLKFYPWCTLLDAQITLPFQSGTVTEPLVYEQFPFAIHDYEYMYDTDLPSDPAQYAMPWSSFSNDALHVGLIWQGKVERVLYGLRWMPALIATRQSEQKRIHFYPMLRRLFAKYQPKNERQLERYLLKRSKSYIDGREPDFTHYYTIGYGDKKATERVWYALTGQKGNDMYPVAKRINMKLTSKIAVVDTPVLEINVQLFTEHMQKMNGILSVSIIELAVTERRAIEQLQKEHDSAVQFTFPIDTNHMMLTGTVKFENEQLGICVTEPLSLYISHGDEEGVQIVESIRREKTIVTLTNASLQVEMSPDFQASLTGIHYKEKNLVQSYFPKLGKWGQQRTTPAGIHPQGLAHEITASHGYMFEKGQMENFTYERNKLAHTAWEGVACHGENYTVAYYLMPAAPVIRVDIAMGNEQAIALEHVIMHFYWNRYSRERTIYYWHDTKSYQLKEAKVKRRMYPSEAKAVLHLGKELYVAIWTEEKPSQLAISEWVDKGFQVSLIVSPKQLSKQQQSTSFFIAVTTSLEAALAYVHQLNRRWMMDESTVYSTEPI